MKRLRSSLKTTECFSLSHTLPLQYYKGLLTTFPFTSTPGETEQASEPESDMKLSEQEFFLKTMINMLRALMDKMDDMPEQMDNTSTEMELQRENF